MNSNSKNKRKSSDSVKSGNRIIKKSKKERQLVNSIIEKLEPTYEELQYRKAKLNEIDVTEKNLKYLKCTTCQWSYKSVTKSGEKISAHPFLDVLMCEKCCDFYEDGDFSVDSDGEDKYCRWCGEGGTLFSCSKCIHCFCSVCLKKHLGPEYVKKVKKDDEWVCLICDPRPLWDLRFVCFLAKHLSETQVIMSSATPGVTNEEKPNTRLSGNANETLGLDLSDQENSTESCSDMKSEIVENLKKIFKLIEYQTGFAQSWSSKTVTKLEDLNNAGDISAVLKEFQKKKWFLSMLSSNLIGLCNSVDSAEKLISSKNSIINHNLKNKSNVEEYSNISNFLGFMSNQVKAFMENGKEFQDFNNKVLSTKEKLKALSESIETPIEKSLNTSEASDEGLTPSQMTTVDDKESESELKEEEEKVESPELKEKENKAESSELKEKGEKVERSELSAQQLNMMQNDELKEKEDKTESSELKEKGEKVESSELSAQQLNMMQNDLKTANNKDDLMKILAILETA